MNNENLIIAEYQSVRTEVIKRAAKLHDLLMIAAILFFFELIIVFLIDSRKLILILSPIFALIAFNYQANQMTLEAAAAYINSEFSQKADGKLGWDKFYGQHKLSRRFTSFLKTMPLMMPQTLAIVTYFTYRDTTAFNTSLIFLDILFFLLTIINFR